MSDFKSHNLKKWFSWLCSQIGPPFQYLSQFSINRFFMSRREGMECILMIKASHVWYNCLHSGAQIRTRLVQQLHLVYPRRDDTDKTRHQCLLCNYLFSSCVTNLRFPRSSQYEFAGSLCSYVKSHPRNRPWRPIGLWDVKDPTLSRL
jgi:hypothetical protein